MEQYQSPDVSHVVGRRIRCRVLAGGNHELNSFGAGQRGARAARCRVSDRVLSSRMVFLRLVMPLPRNRRLGTLHPAFGGRKACQLQVSNTRTTMLPDGKRFAFTVFDDTDSATLENVRGVYALLAELGFRTTKSCWVVDGDRSKASFPATPAIVPSTGSGCWNFRHRASRSAGTGRPGTACPASRPLPPWKSSSVVRLLSQDGRQPHGVAGGHVLGRIASFGRPFRPVPAADLRAESGKVPRPRPGRRPFLGRPMQGADHVLPQFRLPGHQHVEGLPLHAVSRCGPPAGELLVCVVQRPRYSRPSTAACRRRTRIGWRRREGSASCTRTSPSDSRRRPARPALRGAHAPPGQKNGWFVPVHVVLDHLREAGGRHQITLAERSRLERKWLFEKVRIGTV